MKLALVFDDLIQFGGAERLLLAMHAIWPQAPVYTSVVSPQWRKICKAKNIKLQLSFMQHLPFVTKLNRYYSPFLLHVLAFESFDFSEFDIVLSISSRYAHGVITKPSTTHVCYMNSPARMFWEPVDYFKDESLLGTPRLGRTFLAPSLAQLRLWDYCAAQRVDYFIANSKTPQKRIKKYYGRDSEVVYPFVEIKPLLGCQDVLPSLQEQNYFLIISRLVSWKRIDIALEACASLNLPLVIVGDGPDFKRLQGTSSENIKFLGYVSEDKKQVLLHNCAAVINPQFEDFGIVPLEAMAFGKPVVAYGAGGALETIIPGKTGEFFYEQTPEAIAKILQDFNTSTYSADACIKQAAKFGKKVFIRRIREVVAQQRRIAISH